MAKTFILVASENVPVVDIDNTIFVQAVLFGLLILVLKYLLFDPWLAARDRRAARIGGAIEEAGELREAAAERQADYAARLARARDSAMTIRSDRRKRAEEREAELVGEARAVAAQSLDETKGKIEAEIEAARGDLGDRIDALANDITQRVLGRPA